MTVQAEVSHSLAAVRDVIMGLDGPSGATLRRQLGLRSPGESDSRSLSPGALSAEADAAEHPVQLSKLLQDAIAPSLADFLSRASAVTGESVTSLPVTAEIARLCSADPLETQALLEVVAAALPADWADWSPYQLWNEDIVQHFFSGSYAGRPVYLDLEGELLAQFAHQIGSEAGVPPSDPMRAFCRSVTRTFEFHPDQPPMLQRHVRAAGTWAASLPAQHHQGAAPPPFVAALGLFSLAAEQMHSSGEMRATNYYGRLMELLEVSTDEGRERVERHFRLHGKVLWGHLNRWLSASAGALGFPTARSFDARVHVGLPISQALVREAERSQLPELFARYQLRPGQQFSQPDMRAVLGNWLPSSALTNLKVVWNSGPDAQNQIADVVCAELEHWDGTLPESGTSSQREFQVRLGATYHDIPVPEFSPVLLIRNSDALPLGEYHLIGGDAAGNPRVVTAVPEPGGFVGLVDGSAGRVEDGLALVALRRSIDLLHADGRAVITRTERPLVVMHRDETALFVETARVELGSAHILLVREPHVQEVEQVLSQIAASGYKTLRGSGGVPTGWVLFSGVHVQEITSDLPERLLPLVPLSGAQIEFAGGLGIRGGRWHSTRPPEVVALSGTGQQFSLRLLSEFTVTDALVDRNLGVHAGEARIPLDGMGLPDGNYRVLLSAVTAGGGAGAPLTSRALRLRSGASALIDPPPEVSFKHLGTPALDSWSALSAEPASDTGNLSVSGPVVEGASRAPTRAPDEALPLRLGTIPPPGNIDSLFQRVPSNKGEELEAALDQLVRLGFATITSEGPRLTERGKRSLEDERSPSNNRTPGANPAALAGAPRSLQYRSGPSL